MNDEVKNEEPVPAKPKSNRNKIIIGIVGIIALCCIGTLAYGAYLNSTPEGQATATIRAQEQEATRTEQTSVAAIEATEEARPTDTPLPTDTPMPTNTSAPTDTPAPTNTPLPTDTPRPTNTPIPPTPTPEPIILTGSGDSLVDIEKGDWPGLIHVTGNSGGRHFAVINYDIADQNIDVLVNTTDPYDGVRPLDFLDDEHTFGFEVSATGDWTIEVIPLTMVEFVSSTGAIEGNGDYVFAIEGNARRATITGNMNSHHFAVLSYGDSGRGLLVNTTDPYDGEVRLESGTLIIEVVAEGDWSISFEE